MSKPSKPSATADPGSSGLSPEKRLAFAYLPAKQRPAIEALFAIDAAMGDVVRTTSEPMIGQIRLAWWRERLEELDQGVHAPAEPRLLAAERELLPRGLKGRDLAALERGWVGLFDPFPWDAGNAELIWFRGRQLFALAAELLAKTDDVIEGVGGIWALMDVARHCSDAQSREMLIAQATIFARGLDGVRVPRSLRPLSMLAMLTMESGALAMMKHRLTGRLHLAS